MKKITLLTLITGIIFLTNCGKDDASITPVEIGFDGNTLALAEDIGTGTIQVDLGAAAPIGASFTITIGGSATYGEDYTTDPDGSSGAFTIDVSKGDANKTFSLIINDDDLAEGEETITFSISSENTALELGAFTTLTTTITSNDDVMVVIERSTGKMYSVDPSDGSLTEEMTIMYDGSALTGIKSFVYDPATGKGFIGCAWGDFAKFYSMDMDTGVATLLNDNSDADYERDGIADLLIDGDFVLASTYYDVPPNGSGSHGFNWFNKTTGALEDHIQVSDACCGGALAYGGLSGSVYDGSDDGEIYVTDLTDGSETLVTLTVANTTPFTDVDPLFDITNTAVQNFAEHSNGNVYGIIYFGETGINRGGTTQKTWYLVTIDLPSGAVEYVSTLETNKQTQKHGLAVIPDAVLY